MKFRYTIAAFTLAALVVAPLPAIGSSSGSGEVEVQFIEATATGETTGTLTALFIDHFVTQDPLAEPGFRLDSPHTRVISHHTPIWTSLTDTVAREQLVHEGPATLVGVDAKTGLHMWVLPQKNKEPPRVEIAHPACTGLQPPPANQETRIASINKSRPNIIAHTQDTVRVASCTKAVLVIEGNLSMVLWEWGVDLNGERVRSGADDSAPGTGFSTGTGVGSADELVVEAHNATLWVPLTPETYALYLTNTTLVAGNLYFQSVEGTLPGVLEPIHGADVELEGEFATTITPQGVDQPLVASLAGATQSATADGELLSLAPPTPSESSPALVGIAVAGIVFIGLISGRFLWPWFHRQQDSNPPGEPVNAPTPTPRPGDAQRRANRAADAEKAVLRAVRKNPGATGRRLRDRLRMSSERVTAAADALVERGILARRGSESRWHYFAPAPNLDEVWKQKAALQNSNLRLALDLLREFAGAQQRELVAMARERLNWAPSTTRSRLHRLADVGLAKTTESGSGGPQSVVWAPAQPTEGN